MHKEGRIVAKDRGEEEEDFWKAKISSLNTIRLRYLLLPIEI